MRKVGPAGSGLALLAAIALLVPATPVAAAPPPGYDLFETDPATTQLTFEGPTALPPGFFGSVSDPFVGQVHLAGAPLDSFMKQRVGDADTVVRRLSGTPADPSIAPIELVELSLQSVEPITVTYGGGQVPEQWTLEVSPSPTVPSQGAIAVSEKGTFDSKLQVVPLLTFTRLSDGSQRLLDIGTLPPSARNALGFQQANAPWRKGCVLPALSVPSLSAGFCPGLTPGGEKKLTVEQALLASHGVYPAQPSLEHFQCYSLRPSRFRPRGVALSDQFGARRTRATRRAELCNPVRKNSEPFVNRQTHLQCYSTNKGKAPNRLVAVRNQFGSQRLFVGAPRRLCVPSAKRVVRRGKRGRLPRIQVPTDHFQCYSVRERSPRWAVNGIRGVKLRDQFGRRGARVGAAFQLCAPVRKQWRKEVTKIQHPVKHLVCYRVKPRRIKRRARIGNQFDRGVVVTRQAFSLCLPSSKLVLR